MELKYRIDLPTSNPHIIVKALDYIIM